MNITYAVVVIFIISLIGAIVSAAFYKDTGTVFIICTVTCAISGLIAAFLLEMFK